MEWQRILNSFIFAPANKTNLYDSNNFKISSNICDLYSLQEFTLDDITNISYNIVASALSASKTIYGKNHDNSELPGYIHNIKISISIRIEYDSGAGIKIYNCSTSIGDFIISSDSNSNPLLHPLLLCLWLSNTNRLNLTLTYALGT